MKRGTERCQQRNQKHMCGDKRIHIVFLRRMLQDNSISIFFGYLVDNSKIGSGKLQDLAGLSRSTVGHPQAVCARKYSSCVFTFVNDDL